MFRKVFKNFFESQSQVLYSPSYLCKKSRFAKTFRKSFPTFFLHFWPSPSFFLYKIEMQFKRQELFFICFCNLDFWISFRSRNKFWNLSLEEIVNFELEVLSNMADDASNRPANVRPASGNLRWHGTSDLLMMKSYHWKHVNNIWEPWNYVTNSVCKVEIVDFKTNIGLFLGKLF